MNKHILPLVLLLFFSYMPTSFALQNQSASSIKKAVKDYISSNLTLNTEYKINQIQFDDRLKLPLCTTTLEISGPINQQKSRRNSIGVKCNGVKKWIIYTSVSVSIYKNIVVLSQAINRGEIFTRNMLQIERKDVSTLRSGYLTDPMFIVNKQVTRNLSIGSVITKKNLQDPKIIKRGEKIYITANTANLNISMAGIAMMDGSKGQNIRVKNIKSQQIIQATVTKPGQVMVLF